MQVYRVCGCNLQVLHCVQLAVLVTILNLYSQSLSTGISSIIAQSTCNERRAVEAQTVRYRSKVLLSNPYSTFIILGPTKDSLTEDKSFA